MSRVTPSTQRLRPAGGPEAETQEWGSCRAAGIDWQVHPAHQETLLTPQNLAWCSGEAAEPLSTVKHGPHRTVYRLALPAGEYYCKHFRVPDIEAFLRNAFRGTPASRELLAAQRIAALGLPTFEPVALGIKRRLGVATDGYLVSRAIPDALSLDHFLLTEFAALSPSRKAALRQDLARQLGRFAARLHAAGIEHVDLHAGNVLIREHAGAPPALWLIDLHSVRFHRTLSASRRSKNLSDLHQFFAGRSTRSDRLRFLMAYRAELARGTQGEPADTAGHLRTESEQLERLLDSAAESGWRRADRAWLRGNRHVRRVTGPRGYGRGIAALDEAWLRRLTHAPEALFEYALVGWCKRTPRCRVAQIQLDLGDETLRGYWKCRDEEGGWRGLLRYFRHSPARQAWEAGHALLRRGIDTPRPLAVVEQSDKAVRRSYLLTEAVEEAVPLDAFLQKIAANVTQQRTLLRRPLERLADQVRRLHAAGFDHRDLKFSNLLLTLRATSVRLWLLDLDHVRRWNWLPRERAVQNLARLNVSAGMYRSIGRTDRLRFLKRYLQGNFDGQWKLWWRRIADRSARKVLQNASRSRPLS